MSPEIVFTKDITLEPPDKKKIETADYKLFNDWWLFSITGKDFTSPIIS